MGRLKSLTILLTLGAWGAATDGAPPDDAPGTAAQRAAPPAPPGEYVKAGVKLYQSNQRELAAKYLGAAQDYRDQLSAADQATLDQYRGLLAAPKADPAVAPASTAPAPTPAAMPEGGPMGRGGATSDPKQQARWLLQSAREQIRLGNLDEAQRTLDQARTLDVRWNLFELDTPTKVAESLAKARAAAPPPANVKGDRTQARARLKKARDLLEAGQFDQAEGLAREVASWGLSYGLRDDTPRKVVAASRSLRQRDGMRQAGAKGQPSQESYDILVQEARQLTAAGQLDEAEAKARQAHALGVSPALTADRAETVLHDVAMIRARGGVAAPRAVVDAAVSPAGGQVVLPEPPAAAAEREANALLAQGKSDAARAKFEESLRLQTHEVAAPSGPAPAPALADPGVMPVVDAPAPEPAAAPMPMPEPAPAAEGKPGEALLDQSRTLLTGGNFAAAKQAAQQARDGGFGLDAAANDLLSQIALAEQAGNLSLYEAALDAMRKGEPDRARALLTELASTDLDDSMTQKVQDLLARLGKGPAGRAAVGGDTDAETVAAQKLNAEVGTRVADARRLMETDPEQAIALLQKTLDSVKAATLSAPVARTMTRRLEVAIELAKKDKVAFDIKMKDKDARAEVEKKRLRILEADKAKKEQMSALMDKAHAALTDGRLEEAEKLYNRAKEIDPNEIAAIAGSNLARTRRHYEASKGNRAAQDESNLVAWEDVDAASVVSTDAQRRGIDFPKTFADLTRSRRDLASRLQPKKDPKVVAIEAELNKPVSLNIDKQSLGETLDYLRNYTGLNIVPDMGALAEEGLTLASPVSLVVKDIKLKNALKLLLDPLHLSIRSDNEVLLITNPTSSRSRLVTYAYGVADLVVPLRDPKNPFNLDGTPAAANPPAAPGVPGMPVPAAEGQAAGNGGWATKDGTRNNVTPDMFIPLISLIKATVAPGTWRNDDGIVPTGGAYGMGAGLAGGGAGAADDAPPVGSITPFFLSISLIIRHTAEVHDDVVDLLRQLRRLQDLQVSIEVRFITVSDSFFEQIGVDFDFAIQSDVAGRKSSFAQVNPALGFGNTTGNTTGTTTGNTGTNTANPFLVNAVRDHSLGSRQPVTVGINSGTIGDFTPSLNIPFQQGSASAIAPFNALTSNTGATFGISFLSDLEVYLFLTAVQGDTRSNLVQAPKVTTFNGAPASVVNVTNRNYVATLIPIVANGAVAFQPSISQFQDGVQLFVTPVVSADRRYVRMTLTPNFQTFIQFDTFTIPAAVSGFLGGSGTINAQVQLPVFSQTFVQTTVTVPDGGTVLLGGVKRLREERREFGVPILAKTPLINRLFRNVGIGRTTDSLMLMVTPRIIILEEEEERLGIPAVPTVPF